MKLVMGGEEKKPPKNQTKDTAFTMYLILVGDKVRRRMNFDRFVEVICAFSPRNLGSVSQKVRGFHPRLTCGEFSQF